MNKSCLSAKKFFYDFIEKTDKIRMGCYKYYCKEFTKNVTKRIVNILEDNNIKTNKEYYRIDVIGFQQYETEISNKPDELNTHLWKLIVAVEHENNHRDWTDELTKLLFINCPLKVLISYNHADKRDTDDKYSDKKKLEYAAKVIKKLSPQEDPNNEFLIIIGNCYGIGIKEYDVKDYRGYLYDKKEETFQRIKNPIRE